MQNVHVASFSNGLYIYIYEYIVKQQFIPNFGYKFKRGLLKNRFSSYSPSRIHSIIYQLTVGGSKFSIHVRRSLQNENRTYGSWIKLKLIYM